MESGSSRTSRFHRNWEPRLRLDVAIGRLEQLGLRVDSTLARKPWLNIFVLTMVFLACTSVRALRRPLWFDEILTRYIAALPTFDAIYKALANHTESNPPLFHLVSKVSASALGWNEARSRYGRAKMAVERAVRNLPAVVIRPGLVYGDQPGGVFGSIQRRVNKSSLIPLIGDGSYAQYLVHEEDVGAAVVAALNAVAVSPEPVCVAHSEAWPVRMLIEKIAKSQKRRVRLVPVPWQLIYCGLRVAELMAIRVGFRSDSVLSLVYPNPHPKFNCAYRLGVRPRPFRYPTRIAERCD